jgi:dynein assembly factor with WDR repeat domains 1
MCPTFRTTQGTRLLTASNDRTCRLWDAETGRCLQVLSGHADEVFSCAFNYAGDTIITGSKDNTCRVWRVAAEDGIDIDG